MSEPIPFPLNPPQEQPPPHNLEAEMGLIGAILRDNRLLSDVQDILSAEHFYITECQRLYTLTAGTINHGQTATPVTLQAKVNADPDLSTEFVAECVGAACIPSAVTDHAKVIVDLWTNRESIAIHDRAAERHALQDWETTPDQINTESVAALQALQGAMIIDGEGLRPLSDILPDTMQEWEDYDASEPGISTGILDLNSVIGGYYPSDLIVIAGRPGMGKTIMAMTAAMTAARNDLRVAVFSMEMADTQLAGRLITGRSGVSSPRNSKERYDSTQWSDIMQASNTLKGLPIYIDARSKRSVHNIRRELCQMASKGTHIDLVVIDYLQLMSGDNPKDELRLQIMQITRDLKALAKEFDIPIILLSQLNRSLESRNDKHPQMSDLRESGSIEEDADNIIFLYRDWYYNKTRPEKRVQETGDEYIARVKAWQESENIIELDVAKNRHGEVRRVEAFFDPKNGLIRDLQRT